MSVRLNTKAVLAAAALAALAGAPAQARSPSEILAASQASEWRRIDPAHTLYLDLESGRVVIELAPGFAPHHAANIEALVRAGYFDHAFIVRSQDNYVVQWSQPDTKAPLGTAQRTLKAEFERPIAGVPFDVLPDPDTYAPEVGFAWGMPAARDPKLGTMWLAHCYGMVGAGRDEDADSGGGTELYAVNGEAPRNLDRNVTLVGRVVQGMELLSSLPRGTGDMGFYKTEAERIPIQRVRLAADVPAAERQELEALKTDSASFRELVESRRNRKDSWYKVSAGRIGLCNAPLPVRAAGKG
jgi:peptidylprolyl isomerase